MLFFQLTYNGYGEQLRVMVEHDDTIVDTTINTLSLSPVSHSQLHGYIISFQDLAFDFQKDHLKARVIMKASVLKDAFKVRNKE